LLVRGARLAGGHDPVDILCADGRIVEVGRVEHLPDGVSTLDASGCLALPAFIDVHSHADARAWRSSISAPKAWQGVALEIVGNCGLGPAPIADPEERWLGILAGIGMELPHEWRTASFADYRKQLAASDARAWPRSISLLPYTSVRVATAGWQRELDPEAIARVREGVERGLAENAVGVSLGLVYPPSDAATFAELRETLRPLARARGVLATHIRSQANWWIEAIDEVIRLAAELDLRLLISHLCVGGTRNQWKVPWVLSRLREARRAGIDVWFDQHPYPAGQTSLTQLLPPWALTGEGRSGRRLAMSVDELSVLLAVPSAYAGWENYVELNGAERILLAADEFPDINGRTLADVVRERGGNIAQVLVDLIAQTDGAASIILLGLYDEAAIDAIAQEPFGCLSTDGVHTRLPHPRLYGTYPYAFARLVRRGVISEQEFVARSARRPAQIFGLHRAGDLIPGEPADFLIVDPDTFDHPPDYLAPHGPVLGLRGRIFDGIVQPGGAEESAA
jgi:N-acyl-D-aspartate/D-glutamate deacylase